MNVLLCVLQIALAFLYISGGAYKVFKVGGEPLRACLPDAR
jgi:hypothetical protein